MLDEKEGRREAEQELRVDRIRWMLFRRDAFANEVADLERCIAELSREYADAEGLKVRPTLEQLRRLLLNPQYGVSLSGGETVAEKSDEKEKSRRTASD